MTNLVRRLVDTAADRGWMERPAYFVDEDVHRYEDVYAGAARAAAAYASRGLGPGARILLALPDGIEFVRAFLGALHIGAVAVPVNSMLHPDEMRRAADIARPAVVVSVPEFAERFAVPVLTPDVLDCDGPVPAYAPCTTDTPAFTAFTSGTTGGPKLCFHTHGDPEILSRAAGAAVGVGPDDVSYSVPRMNFAYGLGNSLFFSLLSGGSTVLTPRRLAPGDSLAVLERYGVSVFYSQPTFFAHMLGHPDAARILGGLRVAVVAGEVLPESLERTLRGILGPRLLNVYGTTEIGHALLANGPGEMREFTLGRVLPPYRLRVVGDDGEAAAPGVEGRLEVSGPTIGLGVPHGDAAPVRLAADQWYSTSDAATMDADGFVRVHGRLDDVEIVGGVNVHPTETEDRLMAHPAVEEAAVCAVRQDTGISVLRAYAVLRDPLDSAAAEALRGELLLAAADSLTWYKVPHDITFVARLPRNPTGKLLRRTIRALAAEDSLR
ncbi:AMP-binding protein [Streptomyces goshikiensis]|uniref:AMP-binding protein n=1 Tax=Streptomyces goshikiensis TaxID=1942 RepID=UPI00368B1D2E